MPNEIELGAVKKDMNGKMFLAELQKEGVNLNHIDSRDISSLAKKIARIINEEDLQMRFTK